MVCFRTQLCLLAVFAQPTIPSLLRELEFHGPQSTEIEIVKAMGDSNSNPLPSKRLLGEIASGRGDQQQNRSGSEQEHNALEHIRSLRSATARLA